MSAYRCRMSSSAKIILIHQKNIDNIMAQLSCYTLGLDTKSDKTVKALPLLLKKATLECRVFPGHARRSRCKTIIPKWPRCCAVSYCYAMTLPRLVINTAAGRADSCRQETKVILPCQRLVYGSALRWHHHNCDWACIGRHCTARTRRQGEGSR